MADHSGAGLQRMTGSEALMWHAERDPVLRSSFTNITLLDRAPELSRLQSRMSRVVNDFPRLRQRVRQPALSMMGPPEWVEDADFDLDYHVHRVALPAPADERAVLDWAATASEEPFDTGHPLWQFTVLEGLPDGHAALIARLHHTITDGVGGLRLSMSFLDLDREGQPEDRQPPARPDDWGAGGAHADGPLATLVGELRRQFGWVPGFVSGAVAEAADLMSDPRLVAREAAQAVETARSVVRQAVVTGPSLSPMWAGHRSVRRRFEAATLDLETLRQAAHRLGGTVNDAYVTVVTGAAGAYHRHFGLDVHELRLSMPVNVRRDRSVGGNAFVPTRLVVPAGAMAPDERFRLIHECLAQVKAEPALGMADVLAGVVANLPPALIARVARQQVGAVDFAASNLRGSPVDLYVAGARVLANHPMGPTGGTAFNATVLSYHGQLDLGLVVDSDAIEDPELLRRLILDEAAALTAAD